MTFSAYFKDFMKKSALTALALSLVLTVMTPLFATAVNVDVTTAKSNETSTNNVLGGTPTRVTWECVAEKGEQVAAVHVQLPQGSEMTEESTVRLTVLEDINRLDTGAEAVIDTKSAAVDVTLPTPLAEGQRLRVEMYKTSLPNVSGDVVLTGTATLKNGETVNLPESPAITVSSASPEQKIVNWLDQQPFVEQWNSVTVLNTFLKPQLIVQSIPTVAMGWLLSLMLVFIGFPVAIPIGLIFAFMKISHSRILHVIAALYTGIIRGTPLFLQIYIAFFGLPMMGITINEYVLAILVLAFNSGAYLTEIFRAGIQSIPKGQFEASRSLGMTQMQTMFHVVLPQMVRRVIPTMTSEFILLYKDTSLLAAVGVMELMLFSKSIVATTGNMTPYIVAAAFYLIVTLPLIKVVTLFENRLAIADGNAPSKPEKKSKNPFAQMKKEIIEEKKAPVENADNAFDAIREIAQNAEAEKGGHHE